MAAGADVERAGERVEELLGRLQSVDASVAVLAEDMVRELLVLYGAALSRVLELADDDGGRLRMAADPLLSALLVLHGLHPEPAEVRIEKALDGIRPHLGSHAGGVELVDIDGEGVVRLRLEGSCHGCPSSAATVRDAVQEAVMQAAPEVAGVEVDGLAPSGTGGFVPLESVGLRCPTQIKVEVAR